MRLGKAKFILALLSTFTIFVEDKMRFGNF